MSLDPSAYDGRKCIFCSSNIFTVERGVTRLEGWEIFICPVLSQVSFDFIGFKLLLPGQRGFCHLLDQFLHWSLWGCWPNDPEGGERDEEYSWNLGHKAKWEGQHQSNVSPQQMPVSPLMLGSYYKLLLNIHAQIIINARTTTGFKFSKIPETPAVTGPVIVEIVLCLTHLYKLLYFCFSNYGLLETHFPCFYYKYFC